MGEAVKIDLNKFLQPSNSSKSDYSNYSDSGNKSSFKDVFKSYSTKNDSDVDNSKSNFSTRSKTDAIDDKDNHLESNAVNQKAVTKKDTKEVVTQDTNADKDNTEQLTDEQKEKLDKVKKLLEEIFSGTEGGDKKIDELLAKISKLMSSSDNSDTKKENASKLSDNILEEMLSAMNMQGLQVGQGLNSNSISELKKDLEKLISFVANDNNEENSKNPGSDLIKNLEIKDTSIKSSALKLSQMLASSSETDEEKLTSKIKQELSTIASQLNKSGDEKTDNSIPNKSNLNLNALTSAGLSENKSGTSAQNSDTNSSTKQGKDGNLSQDDKFLNDLVGDNKDSQNDKFSKVTNLFSQFSIDSTNKTATNTETPIVTRVNFSADIIKSLKFMESNNIKDLTIKIMPKELGEVIIKITSDGGIMKASITATNKEAYSLLNSNLQDLNNSLTSQNIKIQNVDINIYNGDTTFFSGNDSKENGSNSNNKKNRSLGSIDVDEIDNIAEQDENNDENNINALA